MTGHSIEVRTTHEIIAARATEFAFFVMQFMTTTPAPVFAGGLLIGGKTRERISRFLLVVRFGCHVLILSSASAMTSFVTDGAGDKTSLKRQLANCSS
jgi:hypothetical protein